MANKDKDKDKEIPAFVAKKEVSVMLTYEFLEQVLDLDTEILKDRLDALAYRGCPVEGFLMDDSRECLIITGVDQS